MGCGGSKVEQGQEARLRPILHRRMEEFITRRHGGISKKQLLAADATISRPDSEEEEEEEKDQHQPQLNPNKHYATPPSSPPRNVDHPFYDTQQCPTSQIITPIDDNFNVYTSNSSQEKEDSINDNGDKNNGVNDDDDSKNVDEINNEDDFDDDNDKVKISSKESSQEEEKEEEEEGNFEDLARVDFFPASPSFRVYCIQSLDDELHGHHLDYEESNQEDEKDCSREESTSSNKVVVMEKEVIKKHKRGIMKLKLITIPKGARKSIMHNMQSLYNFPCSCNSHNSHQLVQQAVA